MECVSESGRHRRGYLRLHGVADTDADQDGVANLLVKPRVFVQRRHETQTNRPAEPAEEDTLSVPADPMNDQPRQGAADRLYYGNGQQQCARLCRRVPIDELIERGDVVHLHDKVPAVDHHGQARAVDNSRLEDVHCQELA